MPHAGSRVIGTLGRHGRNERHAGGKDIPDDNIRGGLSAVILDIDGVGNGLPLIWQRITNRLGYCRSAVGVAVCASTPPAAKSDQAHSRVTANRVTQVRRGDLISYSYYPSINRNASKQPNRSIPYHRTRLPILAATHRSNRSCRCSADARTMRC